MKNTALAATIMIAGSFALQAHAADCNPKAITHQQRAANIKNEVDFGGIPSQADQDFLICMLTEKEDKKAYRQRIQALIQGRAQQQAQAEAQRRAAAQAEVARKQAEARAAEEKTASVNRLMTTLPAGMPVEVRNTARQYFEAPGPHKAMVVALGGPVPIAKMEVGSSNLAYAEFQAGQSCYYSTNASTTNKPSGCKLLLADESVIWRSSAPLSALEKGTYVKVSVPCGGPYKGLTLRFDDSGLGKATGGSKVEFVDTEQPNLFRSIGDNGLLHGNGNVVVRIQSPTQFHWLWRNDEEADYRKCSDE